MRRVIWKYRLSNGERLSVPVGATVRHLGWQEGAPTLWLECDEGSERVEWTIQVIGTGQPFDYRTNAEFLGTLIEGVGMFVWHFFAIRGDKWSAEQQSRYESGGIP